MCQISIIVPVYNVEQYIRKCLDSICQQTFTEFELILVDDGSTDESGKICDEYACLDSRIHVFHKSNEGVSIARNTGLNHAKGAWIAFIDSDDWVHKEYLQNFIEQIEANTDLVIQSFWKNWLFNDKEQLVELPTLKITGNYRLVQWLENCPNVHNGFIWHRLFKKSIIERERACFAEGVSFAEDGWFFFLYLKNVQHIKVTSKAGYHYNCREGSLTSTVQTVPLEVHEKVLRGYISSLYAMNVPSPQQEEHIDFTRRYIWRLIESWILKYEIKDKQRIGNVANFINAICRDYEIDKLHDVSPTLRWLIASLQVDSQEWRVYLLRTVLWIRKYEQKIKRHL